jgi:iron(III) transport system permease protein
MNGLVVLALAAAALVAAPLVSVALNVFIGGTGDTWSHLASTVLPDYVASKLIRCQCRGGGHGLAGDTP